MTIGAQVKQTLASVKSARAILNIYAIQTQNSDERHEYINALETTERISEHLEDRIKILEFEEPQYKGN